MKQGKMSRSRLSGLKDEQDLGTQKIRKSSNQANPDADNRKQSNAPNLPKGWEKKTFGEVLDVLRNGVNCKQDKKGVGEKISRIESISSGEFDIDRVGYTYLNEEEKAKYKLEYGDILFSHINSPIHVGKTAIFKSDNEIYHGVNLLLMRPKPFLDKTYFEHYLKYLYQNGYWRELCKQSVNQASVNQQDIKKTKIAFPPLPEQKRIVSILDECFAAIAKAKANAEQNLQNAKELFESYLQGVFENGNWETKKLNEITEVKDGTHDSPKYIKEGIPFITQKNIKPDGLSFDDTKFITDTDHEKFYKRSNVAYGDILISMIGANRGMAAIVDDKRVFSIKNVGLIKSSENINMNYLLYYLKSSKAMHYVLYMSNGGAQEFVGLTALRSFPIPLPSLKQQQTIVRQLDALRAETQKLEAVYQQKIADLEELKKSVLQKAFSGQLKTEKAVIV
jgi:type I restriction enzyme S subunit